MKRKPFTPYIPLDEERSEPIQHDSQGLLDAVKSEFFPNEVAQWYTVDLVGPSNFAGRTVTEPHIDLSTDFASLAGIYARAR